MLLLSIVKQIMLIWFPSSYARVKQSMLIWFPSSYARVNLFSFFLWAGHFEVCVALLWVWVWIDSTIWHSKFSCTYVASTSSSKYKPCAEFHEIPLIETVSLNILSNNTSRLGGMPFILKTLSVGVACYNGAFE